MEDAVLQELIDRLARLDEDRQRLLSEYDAISRKMDELLAQREAAKAEFESHVNRRAADER